MLEIREEELNMVAGGDIRETYDDSCRLYKAGYMEKRLSFYDFVLDWGDSSDMVDTAWKEVGVISVTHPLERTEYIYDLHDITRAQALELL